MSLAASCHLFDTVAILEDLPRGTRLVAGEVGATVEGLADGVFAVEFVDETGHAHGLPTLRANRLIAPRTNGRSFGTPREAA